MENNFLSFEEGNNLQDMINYAASMNIERDNIYPIESLYTQVLKTKDGQKYFTNDKIDKAISEILQK